MLGMKRACVGLLRTYLKTFPCVALLGVRQMRQDDAARDAAGRLEATSTSSAGPITTVISRDPDAFFRLNPTHVAIDEAQQLPEIFPALRVAIDAHRAKKGRFVITGSSSPALRAVGVGEPRRPRGDHRDGAVFLGGGHEDDRPRFVPATTAAPQGRTGRPDRGAEAARRTDARARVLVSRRLPGAMAESGPGLPRALGGAVHPDLSVPRREAVVSGAGRRAIPAVPRDARADCPAAS